jgi:hypothetical protein
MVAPPSQPLEIVPSCYCSGGRHCSDVVTFSLTLSLLDLRRLQGIRRVVVVFRKVSGVAAILEGVCNKLVLFNKWVGLGF